MWLVVLYNFADRSILEIPLVDSDSMVGYISLVLKNYNAVEP